MNIWMEGCHDWDKNFCDRDTDTWYHWHEIPDGAEVHGLVDIDSIDIKGPGRDGCGCEFCEPWTDDDLDDEVPITEVQ